MFHEKYISFFKEKSFDFADIFGANVWRCKKLNYYLIDSLEKTDGRN